MALNTRSRGIGRRQDHTLLSAAAVSEKRVLQSLRVRQAYPGPPPGRPPAHSTLGRCHLSPGRGQACAGTVVLEHRARAEPPAAGRVLLRKSTECHCSRRDAEFGEHSPGKGQEGSRVGGCRAGTPVLGVGRSSGGRGRVSCSLVRHCRAGQTATTTNASSQAQAGQVAVTSQMGVTFLCGKNMLCRGPSRGAPAQRGRWRG